MVSYTKVKCGVASLVAASVCLSFALVQAEEKSPGAKSESAKPAAAAAKESTAKEATAKDAVADGRELFNREWQANDSRAKGGDGLGPVFNDSSCVACHSLGGSGGAGPASKNVEIITAFSNPIMQQPQLQQGPQQVDVQANPQAVQPQAAPQSASLPAAMINMLVQGMTGEPQAATPARQVIPPPRVAPNAAHGQAGAATDDKAALVAKQKEELAKIHPGFLTARSVVLHHFSTNEKYEPWRLQMMTGGGFGQFGQFGGGFNGVAFASGGNFVINSTIATADNTGEVTEVSQPTATVTGTLTLSGVNAQPMPALAAAPAEGPADSSIAVANLSQQAGMQIGQLRMAAQMHNAGQSRQTQVGNFSFVHSQRNATALFGDGLIDKIPESAIAAQAEKEAKDSPDIQGRVSKMKDGKIGRFGWKAQKESLYEFAMTACAVELGLEVPNHPQAGMPLDPKYKAKGNDMDQAECDALVAYLSNLPAPVQKKPADKKEADFISAGEKHFAAVGCTNCHSAKLGEVAGIYSDLLLHDMGADLGDAGNYGSFVPDAPEEEQQNEPLPSITAQQEQPQFEMVNGRRMLKKADTSKVVGAMRLEWRTPPLWGVRDSGPYLHDGRAETLEQAIAFHGGQGAKSAQKFFQLKPEERMQVVSFLKSLTAPDQDVSTDKPLLAVGN